MSKLPRIGQERVYRDHLDLIWPGVFPGERVEPRLTYDPIDGRMEPVWLVFPEPGLRARLLRLNCRMFMSRWVFWGMQAGCLLFIGLNAAFLFRPDASVWMRLVSLSGVLAPIWALVWPRVRARRRAQARERHLRQELGVG